MANELSIGSNTGNSKLQLYSGVNLRYLSGMVSKARAALVNQHVTNIIIQRYHEIFVSNYNLVKSFALCSIFVGAHRPTGDGEPAP